jgi:hypothetical protein
VTTAAGAYFKASKGEIRDMVAPASDFAKVRDFFDKVAGVEGAPVVLIRK